MKDNRLPYIIVGFVTGIVLGIILGHLPTLTNFFTPIFGFIAGSIMVSITNTMEDLWGNPPIIRNQRCIINDQERLEYDLKERKEFNQALVRLVILGFITLQILLWILPWIIMMIWYGWSQSFFSLWHLLINVSIGTIMVLWTHIINRIEGERQKKQDKGYPSENRWINPRELALQKKTQK